MDAAVGQVWTSTSNIFSSIKTAKCVWHSWSINSRCIIERMFKVSLKISSLSIKWLQKDGQTTRILIIVTTKRLRMSTKAMTSFCVSFSLWVSRPCRKGGGGAYICLPSTICPHAHQWSALFVALKYCSECHCIKIVQKTRGSSLTHNISSAKHLVDVWSTA